MASSDTDKVLPIRIVVDYAPVKGKRSVCHLGSCSKVIERGQLRVKEEYTTPPIEGGEAALKYHIECYSDIIDMSKLEGLDKLKEKDKKTVLAKTTAGSSVIDSNNKDEHKADPEEDKAVEKSEEEQTTTSTSTTTESKEKEASDVEKPKESTEIEPEPVKEKEAEKDKEKEKPQQAPTFKNGTKVMAKVRANVSKNLWFSAKVINSRLTALGLREYHVSYTDETVKDLKEWVPEKFVVPPINPDAPPPPASAFAPGAMALGWRRKPGSQTDWCHSVKVLRYLSDVPGAYVQWVDFPFPDSILEVGKVFPIVKEEPLQQSGGLKRQLAGDSENDPLAKKERVT